MNKPKILIVTSKWSIEDRDGGMSTTSDICETLSPYCHLDVLTASQFVNNKYSGIENVIVYDIPEHLKENYNGLEKFHTRMQVSCILMSVLQPLFNNYDRIIVLHVFHLLSIIEKLSYNNTQKIILFPMMLTPSYLECKELVPLSYTNKEKIVLEKVGKIIGNYIPVVQVKMCLRRASGTLPSIIVDFSPR